MTTSTLERLTNTTETEEITNEETQKELADKAIKLAYGPAKLASNFADSIQLSEERSPSTSNY